jgi:hypothetical protein
MIVCSKSRLGFKNCRVNIISKQKHYEGKKLEMKIVKMMSVFVFLLCIAV